MSAPSKSVPLAIIPKPVYDFAQFGQDVVLVMNPTREGTITSRVASGGVKHAMQVSQVAYGAATLEITGTAGVTSTVSEALMYTIDMPAWLYVIRPSILYRLLVGAGNTVDITLRVRVLGRVGTQNVQKTLYDITNTFTGLVADETAFVSMPALGIQELLEQFTNLQWIMDITSTRTAGASNTQIFLQHCNVNRALTSLLLHIHPSLTHAESIYGTAKTGNG